MRTKDLIPLRRARRQVPFTSGLKIRIRSVGSVYGRDALCFKASRILSIKRVWSCYLVGYADIKHAIGGRECVVDGTSICLSWTSMTHPRNHSSFYTVYKRAYNFDTTQKVFSVLLTMSLRWFSYHTTVQPSLPLPKPHSARRSSRFTVALAASKLLTAPRTLAATG